MPNLKSRKRTGEKTQTTAKNVRLNSESTLQTETVNWTEDESLLLKNKSKSEEGFGFTEFEKYDEDVRCVRCHPIFSKFAGWSPVNLSISWYLNMHSRPIKCPQLLHI